MTPAEALEQVRALHVEGDLGCPYPSHRCNDSDYRGNYCADSGTSCEACGEAYPCPTIAILDAVTPDAPVTVEGLLTDRDRMDISAVVHQNYYMPNVFNTVETIVHRHLTPERTEQERDAAVERVRALSRECDLADQEMRKWVRVPVKHVRAAIAAYEGRA